MKNIFLCYCSVSPLHPSALRAMQKFEELHAEHGVRMFLLERGMLPNFHQAVATLLKTDKRNVSYVNNTAEGLGLISNGYPFKQGDEVITYVHEYPSNYHPWIIQSRLRGVKVVELSDVDVIGDVPDKFARGFSVEELKEKITSRTKIVAISHVQFTSGFKAPLEEIGALCRERGVDLIVDAAQSFGSVPLYPDELGISAIAASGWKWLMGPLGSGLLYTSPEFRSKIAPVMGGAELMLQGNDYLDHRWRPHTDGKMFEYSTLPFANVVGLGAVLSDVFLETSLEEIQTRVFELQDLILDRIDTAKYQPVRMPDQYRSGILSLIPTEKSAVELEALAGKKGYTVSARSGYLRIAPHFFVTKEQLIDAVEIINAL